MELDTTIAALPVYEALSSETRLAIINLLGEKKELNLSEIAAALKISNPIVTRHIQKLVDAHLVSITKKPGLSGIQKVAALNIDDIHITLPGKVFPEYSVHHADIGVGLYSNYHVLPTCGLANAKGKIGKFDEPRFFSDNNRISASLLWFSEGYVEYSLPNPLTKGEIPKILEISLELSSEFQGSSNHWPSDIAISINDVEVGTYTVPGNFSDVRGKLTPTWWDDGLSQYGLLKYFRINDQRSTVDSVPMSKINITDLAIAKSPIITLKLAVKKDAAHRGGLTIFGEEFGNHPQNINVNIYYENQKQ